LMSDPLEIAEQYGKRVDVILDGGVISPEPSSVISLVDDVIEVIRAGKGDVSSFQ